MDQASASSVLGAADALGQSLSLTLGDAVGVMALLLLLAGNAFQFYRQRVYTKTVYNQLVSTFNSIGWLLARGMNKTGELNNRISDPEKYVMESAALREFRDYSLETEFMLRVLHEQLVSVAKTLSGKDRKWQAGHFWFTPDEMKRIEERIRIESEAA